MKENDEYEIGENNLNKNIKNNNKEKTHSILDKLRILRDENSSNNLLQKTNIALIKSANDYEIEELIKKLLVALINIKTIFFLAKSIFFLRYSTNSEK